MPAYTMPGLMTGQNTNEIVKKLVELERRPIKRWETENEYAKAQVQVWNEVKNLTANLQTKTRALTSFTAPFATKSVSSSTEGVITGEASRAAKSGERPIEIIELAAKHQLSGVEVDTNVKLPAGKFTIFSGKLSETINFTGGTLSDLVSSIRNSANTIAECSVIKIDKDSSLITIIAVKTGKINALQFSDPDKILKTAGLVGENKQAPESVISPVSIDLATANPYEETKYKNTVIPEQAPLKTETATIFKPDTAFSFPFETENIQPRSYLEFSIAGNAPAVWELGFVFEREGNLRTKLVPVPVKDGKYALQIGDFAEGKNLKKIIITNTSSADIQLASIQLIAPPKSGTAEPLKVLSEAKDAKFKIDFV
ncbi:MAG: hypothetical protein O9264_03015 [Leptospira sp.]|nr:hypothetical protein [Leptospira sp.]